jgi:hypothetical protein
MSTREYIQKELRQMKAECKKYRMTPEEWISRYAVQYNRLHQKEIEPSV